MIDSFIYEMPCLSRYRFNHNGECINIETLSKPVLQTDPKRCKEEYYKLKEDEKDYYSIVRLEEVKQYIKHLKAVQEFNPLVFHHFVIYRPTIKLINKYNKAS